MGKKRHRSPAPRSSARTTPKKAARSVRAEWDRFARETKEAVREDLRLAEKEFPRFWANSLRALGTEPREIQTLTGASGVGHEVVAAGVDEQRRRLIVVSSETTARGAALAQADLQAGMDDLHVLVVRPVLISTVDFARKLGHITGRAQIDATDLQLFSDQRDDMRAVVESATESLLASVSPWIENARSLRTFRAMQWLQQLIEELSRLDWRADDGRLQIDLEQPFGNVSGVGDEIYGTCAFPVYALTPEELERVDVMGDPEPARAVLQRHGVFQFFFPSPDELALGLVDRGTSRAGVAQGLELAPHLGHPYGTKAIGSG